MSADKKIKKFARFSGNIAEKGSYILISLFVPSVIYLGYKQKLPMRAYLDAGVVVLGESSTALNARRLRKSNSSNLENAIE